MDPVNIDQKLLVLYLLDEISGPGREKVEAWLSSSPENKSHFDRLARIWTETGKIDPESVVFDTNRAWERMAARIRAEEHQGYGGVPAGRVDGDGSGTGRKIVFLKNRLVLAAAAVLFFGIASVMLIRFMQTRPQAGFVTLASAGAVLEDTLKDGSTVILNAGSELTVPKRFAENNRSVRLLGEAFFAVHPDNQKPFIIDAGIGKVEVLGTAFRVKAYPGSDLEIYVESGKVELSSVVGGQAEAIKTVLRAGEMGMIGAQSREITMPAKISPDELFWANRKLIFQETRLSLVFDLLKKHYSADIEVKDAPVLNCLLSATFTNETIGQILEVWRLRSTSN
jgi:transmembrane sensor